MFHKAVLGAVLALALPAAAHAQAEPGYTTIFDGTATGSNASFDKWAQVGGGNISLQDGVMHTSGGSACAGTRSNRSGTCR